jgi:hypothetical protein
MTFNNIVANDPGNAAPIMQNFRHINYGNDFLPVDSSGSGLTGTLDLGSTSYRWVDVFYDGRLNAYSDDGTELYQDWVTDSGFNYLRSFGDFTIKTLWTVGDIATDDLESTLSLTVSDVNETNSEFMDLYVNNYVGTDVTMGIAVQKRGTGTYKNFIIRTDDGTTQTEKMKMDWSSKLLTFNDWSSWTFTGSNSGSESTFTIENSSTTDDSNVFIELTNNSSSTSSVGIKFDAGSTSPKYLYHEDLTPTSANLYMASSVGASSFIEFDIADKINIESGSGSRYQMTNTNSSITLGAEIGRIDYRFTNDSSTTKGAANVLVSNFDNTDGAEDAELEINCITNGNLSSYITLNSSGAATTTISSSLVLPSLASSSTGTDLIIDGSNIVRPKSSSRRYKHNIHTTNIETEKIYDLTPVDFTWNSTDENDFGLIAEDVAQILPELCTYRNGQIEGVKYSQIAVLLLSEVKKLREKLNQLSV